MAAIAVRDRPLEALIDDQPVSNLLPGVVSCRPPTGIDSGEGVRLHETQAASKTRPARLWLPLRAGSLPEQQRRSRDFQGDFAALVVCCRLRSGLCRFAP